MGPAEIAVVLTIVVVVLVVLAVAFAGNVGRADRFLALNGLDDSSATRTQVAPTLLRIRRAHRRGAFGGLALGIALGLGTDPGFAIGGAAFGLLAGSLLGIATAAVPHDDGTPVGPQHADLAPRVPADYLPARSGRVVAALAGAIVVAVVVGIVDAPHGLGVTFVLFVFALLSLVAIPLGRRAQRRTIEARRADLDRRAVRVDDALRACAARSIHHAMVGVLMCGLFLAAYGVIGSHVVTDVLVDHHVAYRLPPLTRDVDTRPPAILRTGRQRWHVAWTPPGRSREDHVVRASYVSAQTTGLDAAVWLAVWGSWFALGGALYQYGRAAKAWRRPQRTPAVANGGAPASA